MSSLIGRKGRCEWIVTEQLTAAALGNGSVRVFATPFMIALMEKASVAALEGALEPGQGTVGTRIDATHEAATPVGGKVWAEAVVTAVDRRKLFLQVTAYDERGVIGRGTHERFIIDVARFLEKAQLDLRKDGQK